MYKIIDFELVVETKTKDKTAQSKSTQVFRSVLGQQKSVYQNEFFKAEQAGLRPQGVIEMSSFDYGGEALLRIGKDVYTIYRTYELGTDRIELYYGERVGNGQPNKTNQPGS